jgi:hypothetical protein
MIRPPSACITIPLGNTGANEGGSLALRTEQGWNLSSRREGRGGHLAGLHRYFDHYRSMLDASGVRLSFSGQPEPKAVP